jgi:hypothetical protein
MVSEDAAAALVVRVATVLKLDGYDPVITAENSVRLMRLCALLRAEFGITDRETTEVRGEALHQDPD